MKALNVGSVDICPWALREGIILHYLQTFNQSFDLPLRPLNGSTYGQDAPGGRHVTLVTTSSGQALQGPGQGRGGSARFSPCSSRGGARYPPPRNPLRSPCPAS